MTIGITGATGLLGGVVAARVAASGASLRLVVRDPARAPQYVRGDIRVASYGDRDAAVEALEGVETLFMVSAKESPTRVEEHRTFIDAARDAGVQHVVYTSFAGAAPDATFTFARDHFATETYLADSGMAVTLLRNNFYMDVTPYLAGPDGVIRGPAGDGAAAFVARTDIAQAAARILLEPTLHRGRTYEMTGAEAVDLAAVARLLTRTSGREVSYHPESLEEAYVSRAGLDAEQWELDAWVTTYLAIAKGEMEHVSGDLPALLGSAPITLAEFLRPSA